MALKTQPREQAGITQAELARRAGRYCELPAMGAPEENETNAADDHR
jgi:hypothetical protein